MMTARRINVFVSATTADLGVARKAAQEMLLDAGMYPVTQEHFGPSPLNLVEFIRAEIAERSPGASIDETGLLVADPAPSICDVG